MIFAMTKEQYIKITEPLRSNPERANRVTSLNHVLTALVFCVYPLYLFMLFADKDPWLWRAILVPAVSFVGLSIVRTLVESWGGSVSLENLHDGGKTGLRARVRFPA